MVVHPPPPGGGFSDNFEGHPDFLIEFLPWTNVDVDGSTTYGMTGIDWPNAYDAQSFIVFNPSTTTPAVDDMTPHSGDKFVACMAATAPPNNDWLIAPSTTIAAGATVSFWAKSYTADYGLERFKVGVSTTLDPNDFTIISSGAYVEAPVEDWTEFSYSLAAYVGQDVYVGIQCVSNDAFIFMLDDFSIGATKASSLAFNPPSPITGSGTKMIGESNIDVDAYMAELEELAELANDRADSYVVSLPSTSVAKPLSSDRSLLHDNGPLVNSAGTGAGGADESILMDGITTYGVNCNNGLGYYMSDDFEVTADWTVESFVFYAYQSFAGIPSTITAGYFQVYDGDPSAGGSVIYGDLTTDVMTSTQWSNIYRNNDGPGGNSDRAIMEIECAATGLTLTPGTYWVVWTCEGSASSGPWAPPITIAGQPTTGNALQWTGTAWQAYASGGFNQGIPFLINGTTGGGGGGGFDPGPVLGANVYRDGVMIAEMVQDTFYLDLALNYGMYEYCVNLVYGEGAESCTPSCVDVEVTEDCAAPEDLTAELEGTNTVHLLWDDNTFSEWLFYDDGINVDGIGGPATFIWAIKFDPDQLTHLDGAYVTKISIYCRTSVTNTLQIYEGTDAATLLFEQDLVGLTMDAWNEVELTSAVPIDVSKQLWIGVNTTDGAAYPASCGNTTGEPNGDLISQDGGATWEHIGDLGLAYTWNLRAFATTETTKQVQLGSIVNNNVYGSEGTFAATGIVNTSETAVLDIPDATREFVGYNIYKNGVLLEALWSYNFYDYEEMQIGYQCYTVTAEYSYCGESDPSNEACIDILVGIGEIGDNEVSLYPNPASDRVNITSIHDMTRITVVNYVGQVVYVEDVDGANKVELETDSYQTGVYVVRIETESGIITKRVVIKK